MIKTLRLIREHKAWQREYDAVAPRKGDLAPDFELFDMDGENPVRLSHFRGEKPVALIFGYYT
jgi:cytochrome oxidase Cu insertion factor (SCO1/SenC/PrrC family)